MPLLIRFILQRLLILLYSFLAFLGLTPDTSIPTEAEAVATIEERRQIISDFFEEDQIEQKIQDIVDTGKEISKEIQNITQKETNESPKKETLDQNPTISGVIEKTVSEINSTTDSLVTRGKIDDFVVNIVCSKKDGNIINVSTGSGVIIDPDGVIITNAHVGQFVLIEDNYKRDSMKCAVYKESIPTFGYLVDALYVSPQWIAENYKLINSTNPMGTGENDYAFLYITKSTNPTTQKPSQFPYSNIMLNENIYETGRKVTVAGYPGAPQKLIEIISAGVLKKSVVSIIDVFTFKDNTIDIISTTKSTVGAKGASGGGVFDNNNNLIAIISTTNGEQNNAEINAITTTYINNSLRENTGKSISTLVKDPEGQVKLFNKTYGANLANLLIKELGY